MAVQLDRTELAIRQRSTPELFDLSLVVLRRHARPILASMALLGIPLLAIDLWLTAGMLSEDAILAAESTNTPEATVRLRHAAHVIGLFYMQFQIASLPTSIVLGNLVFFERLSISQLLAELRQGFVQWMAILGVVRLGLVGWAMELFTSHEVAFDYAVEPWFFFGLLPVIVLVRATRPFAPEILGLEKCPWLVRTKSPPSYGTRSANLHRFMVGDNIVRHFACMIATTLLACSLAGTLLFIQGTATGTWTWNSMWDYILLPAVLWCVGLFAAVFRFLSYLDCRIRMEGWEIELMMRAEGERQRAAMTPPASGGPGAIEEVVA